MRSIFILFFVILYLNSSGQTPTTGDCLGAIPICTNSYSPSTSAVGIGNYSEETGAPCGTFEQNSTWYTFTVETAGWFTFTLNSSVDYDYALYDVTNNSCADIANNTISSIRCNYSATTGNTGLNTSAVNADEGASGSTYCSAIFCSAGQKFALLVDNYTGGATNYWLQFNPSGSGGTAGIYDNTGPALGSVTPPPCGSNTLTFQFSEDIACSSVSAGDLTLTGPGGPYTLSNIVGTECSTGATNGRIFTVNVSPSLYTSGNFVLSMVGTISDKCNNPTNTTVTLPFTITNVTASTTVSQPVSCYTGSNGAITANPAGGSTPYTYIWSNGQTGATATGLAAGSYAVTVTDAFGCSAQASASLTQPPALIPGSITSSQSICYNTVPSAITNTASASGGSGAVTYQWQYTTDPSCASGWADISGANSVNYSPPALTQTTCYRRKATDNCSTVYQEYSNSVTVTVNPLPVINSATKTDVSICGGSNGTITISATGNSLTYSVDNISFVNNGGVFSGLSQGSYQTAVMDASGCTVLGPVLVINASSAPPAPSAGNSNTYCQGQPLTNLWATDGYSGTLKWYDNPSLTTPVGTGPSFTPYNNTGPTNYYVTETVGGCESGPAQITITINLLPVASAAPYIDTICSGTSTAIDIVANTDPGTTYTWSFVQSGVTGVTTPVGNSIYQVLTASPSTGTVNYIGTPLANGCVGNTFNVPVTVNPNPTAVANPASESVCSLDTTNVALSSSLAGVTFSWTATENNAIGSSAGAGDTISQVLQASAFLQGSVTYHVTPVANTCVGPVLDVVITVNPKPDVTATPPSGFICSGDNILINLTSQATSPTFSWTCQVNGVTGANPGSGSSINQILTCDNPATGTVVYQVVPVSLTCTGDTLDVPVTVNPKPTVSANPTAQTVCTFDTANICFTSDVAGASFTWTVAHSSFVLGAVDGSGPCISQVVYNTDSIAEIATYTVTAGYFNCSSLPLSVPVTINPYPLVTATPPTDTICSGTGTNFSLTSNVTGAAFDWTVSSSVNITGANNGNGSTIAQTLVNNTNFVDSAVYTVIANANSCPGDTASIPVYVNPQPVIDSTNTANTSCGGADGTITIFASGAAPFEYSIDGAITFVSNGGSFSGLSSTNYAIAARDANGCVTLGDTLYISELNAPLAPSAGTDTSYCSGDPMVDMTATPSAGGTLTWYSDLSLTTVIGTGASLTPFGTVGSTNYYVTESTGGCEGPSTIVTILIKALPVLIATPASQIICSGGTTSISLSSNPAGGTFDWTVTQNSVNGATAGSGGSINQTLATNGSVNGTAVYSVVTHANGCDGAPTDVTVFVNALPVVSLNLISQVCQNVSSINLGSSGSPPGGIYSGPGISGNTFIPSAAGTGSHIITYTYTDTATTCTNSATDTITVISLPNVTLAPFSPVCAHSAPFALTGGNPSGGTYLGTGVYNGIFYPDSAGVGSHTITYIDTVSGCSGFAVNTLNVTPLPEINSITKIDITCFGFSDGIATANVSNGTQPYSYLWSNSQNTATAGGFGPAEYYITVTDFIGCKDIDTVSFTNPSQLTVTESHTDPTCGNLNGSITANPSGGTPSYTYQWSNGNLTQTITGLAAGVYNITVYDSRNCFVSAMVSLTTFPAVAVSIITINPSCHGFTDGSVTAIVTGGTQPYTYAWSNLVTTPANINLPAGTVSLTVTDANLCSYSDTILLTQPDSMQLSLQVTNVTCYGLDNGEILPTVSGGTPTYTYQWSPSASGSSLTAGVYSLTVTDSRLCTVSASDTVHQPQSALQADITGTDIKCYGDSTGTAIVTPTGGTPYFTYLWNTNPIQTSAQAINLKAGLYRVTVTDFNMCLAFDTIRITESSQINMTYDILKVSCEDPEAHDGEFIIHATGGVPFHKPDRYNYIINSNPAQYDSTAESLYKGTYEVRVEDSLLCFRLFNAEVTNISGPCLVIPSVFTPNADNLHDRWDIKNLHFYPKATIEVYNRWGNLIYNKTTSDERWDGKYNGVDVPSGTYIYIIDLKNETKPKEGTVSVIR